MKRSRAAVLLFAVLALSLAGCGTLRSWVQLPLGGRPSVGTSIDVPLGSGGGKR